jgi:hypothetical protein
MPITEELKTAQDLRDAGLPQRVAELLAAKLEATAQATRDSAFRDFRGEFRDFRGEINARFDALHAEISTSISGLRAEIASNKADVEKSLRQMQGVLLTAILGTGSIIIAILVALKLW